MGNWSQALPIYLFWISVLYLEELTDCIVHGGVVAAGQELRVEVDHHQAAVLGQGLQDVVLDVAARVAELVGRGV